MISGLPFDDLRNLARQLPPRDDAAAAAAAAVSDAYAAAAAPLGRLAEMARWLAATSGRPARVLRPLVALFAGTYGMDGRSNTAEVQAYVDRTAAGGSAVNQACAAGDVGLKIFDLALDVPVDDPAAGAAMDEKGCAATVAFGMEAVAGGIDLLVLCGHGGAAGAASAEALLAACGAADAAPDGPAARALAAHRGHLTDPLEALRRLGGRETAALVGALVAARMERVPVVLDGRAALAAAAVVARLAPDGLSHCMAADGGGNPVADRAAEALSLPPLLQLGLGGHDGAAGAIAAGLLKTAALVHGGAAEFVRRSQEPR